MSVLDVLLSHMAASYVVVAVTYNVKFYDCSTTLLLHYIFGPHRLNFSK